MEVVNEAGETEKQKCTLPRTKDNPEKERGENAKEGKQVRPLIFFCVPKGDGKKGNGQNCVFELVDYPGAGVDIAGIGLKSHGSEV